MNYKKIILIILASLGGIMLIGIFISIVTPEGGFGDKIGIIEISGSIMKSELIIKQIHKYRDNDSVKAIVLRINSPGGSVGPVQEIYREVSKLQKPVVTSMGAVAASGGYYIASASDQIFANPGTITGSIGVIMQFIDAREFSEKIGIDMEIIKSCKYKDTGAPTKKLTQDKREVLQAALDDVHSQFVDAVLKGREHVGLTTEKVAQLADGRIFSGRQALGKKLIDQIGNLQDAIKYTAKKVGVTGKPKTIKAKPHKTLLERLLGVSIGDKIRQIFPSKFSLKYELQ